MRIVFEQSVLFVLVDGAEVTASTFRGLLMAHVTAIPAVLVVVVTVLATAVLRRRPVRVTPEEGE